MPLVDKQLLNLAAASNVPTTHRCLLALPPTCLAQQRRWVGVKAVTFRWSNDVRWRASVLVFPHQGSRERRQVRWRSGRGACVWLRHCPAGHVGPLRSRACREPVLRFHSCLALCAWRATHLTSALLLPLPPPHHCFAALNGAPCHPRGGGAHSRPCSDRAAWPQGKLLVDATCQGSSKPQAWSPCLPDRRMLPLPQAVSCTDGRGGAQPAQCIHWIHAHSHFTSQSRHAHSPIAANRAPRVLCRAQRSPACSTSQWSSIPGSSSDTGQTSTRSCGACGEALLALFCVAHESGRWLPMLRIRSTKKECRPSLRAATLHSGLSTGWLRSAHGQADSSLHAWPDLYCHPLPLPAAPWGRTGSVARSRAPLDSTTRADPRSTCGACE